MKMILIAVAALLILAGGGGAAYFFLFAQSAEASVGENEEHQEAKEAHGKKDDGHGAATALYAEIDPLMLPLIGNSGAMQSISLSVVLDVRDEDVLAEIEAHKPRLRDAYIQDMYGVLSYSAAKEGGMLKIGMIKARLKKISNAVLGEGAVNDVLIQVVQQRPL